MMWVRFPNGQCIQYNTAFYVIHDENCRRLFPSKADGDANRNCIAIVPHDCIVELTHACSVTNPLDKSPSETAITRELRSIKRKLAKR